MELENEQDQQEQSSSADGGDGAGDLADVLGAQDATFVTGEKKPFSSSTLVMAGFLLACGVGTYFMYTRNTQAKVAPSVEAAAAQTTITQFLSEDHANVNKMKDLLQNTQAAVEQFKNSPAKAQVPLEELQTNPFRQGNLDTDAPPVTDEVDTITARKREAEAKAATLKAAQTLNLQFIVSGRKKSCLINNTRYVEGDTVGEFTVESIAADSVVIRKGETRFELRMKK
jgi:hypothetical protein